ncbi:hypothetical protein OQA88_8017 [Cercophora sp. LCS_1]
MATPTITLYDIRFATPPERHTCAPNPWKARYALNFKSVPYTTTWVSMLDITAVRKSLHLPAVRKFADGTDFYTLPCITDGATNSAIGDSFDIALYLQSTYPDAGAGDLFPAQDLSYVCPEIWGIAVPLSERNDVVHADYAKFNTNVDWAFTMHTQLAGHGMKWDADVEEEIKREFVRRAGRSSWDELGAFGEARVGLLASLKKTVEALAGLLNRDGSGPFLLGQKPSYADCIVGGWLRMFSMTLHKEEWEEIRGWYGGCFGALHDALQSRFGEVRV